MRFSCSCPSWPKRVSSESMTHPLWEAPSVLPGADLFQHVATPLCVLTSSLFHFEGRQGMFVDSPDWQTRNPKSRHVLRKLLLVPPKLGSMLIRKANLYGFLRAFPVLQGKKDIPRKKMRTHTHTHRHARIHARTHARTHAPARARRAHMAHFATNPGPECLSAVLHHLRLILAFPLLRIDRTSRHSKRLATWLLALVWVGGWVLEL